MRYLVPIFALCCVAFLLAALVLAETPIRVAPQEGVLLLRNGRVLQGKITRDGQRYFVALPIGEIHVKEAEVDRVCPTLAECYQYKRSRLVPGNVNDHLELAAWCITNRLYAQAQRELGDARAAEPRHPKIDLLARRLETVRGGLPKSAPGDAKKAVGPSPERLDAMARELPPGAVEAFTSSIQPMLQNHCSTAGCHGSTSSSSFRLHRLSRTRLISQRFTQRNLYAVLQTIDRDQPAKSPLLTAPTRPHGTAKKPVFQPHDAIQYRQLVAWVYQVANATPPKAGDPDRTEPPTASQGDASVSPKPAPTRTIRRIEGLGQGLGDSPPKHESLGGFTPRDPFDPQIFNRQHFPGQSRRNDRPATGHRLPWAKQRGRVTP